MGPRLCGPKISLRDTGAATGTTRLLLLGDLLGRHLSRGVEVQEVHGVPLDTVAHGAHVTRRGRYRQAGARGREGSAVAAARSEREHTRAGGRSRAGRGNAAERVTVLQIRARQPGEAGHGGIVRV